MGLFAQTTVGSNPFSLISASLWTGIPLCLIGFGMSMFAWRKEGKVPLTEKAEKKADKFGCVGLVIGGLGVFCLIPAIMTLHTIFMSLLGAAILLFVGFVIYKIVK